LLLPHLCTYFFYFKLCTVVFVDGGEGTQDYFLPKAQSTLAQGAEYPTLAIRMGIGIVGPLKGELGELQIYFRKIPLHQQKFLVVSVLSNLPWLPRNLKMSKMKLPVLSSFQLATLFAKQRCKLEFLYLLHDDMN